jgi:hypothetical protein
VRPRTAIGRLATIGTGGQSTKVFQADPPFANLSDSIVFGITGWRLYSLHGQDEGPGTLGWLLGQLTSWGRLAKEVCASWQQHRLTEVIMAGPGLDSFNWADRATSDLAVQQHSQGLAKLTIIQ